jgi:flagellar hook-associated protein 3 FlgL
MRISTVYSQLLGVNSILNQQTKLAKTQLQLSTGLKVLTPADDPAVAARTLDIQETIDQVKQYQDNLIPTRSRLNTEETSLESTENVLFRAKELTIQALNAPLTEQDRVAIKFEVDQLLDNIVSIANTRNANGEYIYSGDLSNTPPIKWDATVQGYVYQGGNHQRVLQIANDRQVADGDLGVNVFDNISSVSTTAGTQGGVQSIFDTLQTLSKALTEEYTVPSGTLSGARFLKYGHDFSSGTVDFNLAVDGGAAATVTLAAANYSSLKDLVAAVNTGINAQGALSGNVVARENGNHIEFVSTTTGSSSAVVISDDTDGFLTIAGFTDPQTGNGADLSGVIVGNSSLLQGRDYSATGTSFNLEANGDTANSVNINLTTNLTSLTAIVNEINTQITSAGQQTNMAAQINGNSIEFVSFSNGGPSTIKITELSGDFLKDAGFNNLQTGNLFENTVNDVLSDLDTALDRILETRTSVGARLRALDDQQSQNEKFVVDMQSTLSEIRDLDYAEAISRFNLQSVALQAAQQAYSRVQNLSLFNFL